MTITISGTNITVTEAMKEQAKKALKKLTKILTANKVSISVKQEKQGFAVHIEYLTDKGTYRATEKNRNFYKALKESVAKIERQIVATKQGFNKGNKPTQDNMSATVEDGYDYDDIAHASS